MKVAKSMRRVVWVAAALWGMGTGGCGDGSGGGDGSASDAGDDAGRDASMQDAGGSPDGSGGGDGGSPDGSEGGDGGSPDGSGGGDGGAQYALEAEVAANPVNGLSAYVEVRADVPVTVEIEVEGAGLSRTVAGGQDADSSHSLGVWGMRADSTYELTVRARTGEGQALESVELEYTTPSLPDDFPPIEVTGTPTAGYTLFNVFRWNPTNDSEWGLLLIVDSEGEVVWYHRDSPGPGDARMLENGHILYAADNDKLVEVDMMGSSVLERTAEAIGTDTVHHEVYPLAGDHLVFLSSALHTDVPGYLDENTDPITEDVVSDVVVEIDGDGELVHAHDVFDVLDPLRTTPAFFSAFWAPHYGDESDAPRDWTHGNAVIHDAADDSFILSLRHQDWLVKLERESGDLVWRFGTDGDFALQGAGSFPSHQHAPELLSDGRVLLFDNGNASQESRAVIYELDESAMTATQDWEFSEGSFAPFVGDADMLDSGNVLVAFGGLVADPSLPLTDAANLKTARLVEVSADADKNLVWQLNIEDDAASDPVGYTVYRAERLEDLYP